MSFGGVLHAFCVEGKITLVGDKVSWKSKCWEKVSGVGEVGGNKYWGVSISSVVVACEKFHAFCFERRITLVSEEIFESSGY